MIAVGDLVLVTAGAYGGHEGSVEAMSEVSGAIIVRLGRFYAAFGASELHVIDRARGTIAASPATEAAGSAGKTYYESGRVRS
jgi:hypothetical protein